MLELSGGTLIEPLDNLWAVYSARSGDTLQLNAEAAAVLELLAPGPMDESAICAALAADTETPPGVVADTLRPVWMQLISTGLVRRRSGDSA